MPPGDGEIDEEESIIVQALNSIDHGETSLGRIYLAFYSTFPFASRSHCRLIKHIKYDGRYPYWRYDKCIEDDG